MFKLFKRILAEKMAQQESISEYTVDTNNRKKNKEIMRKQFSKYFNVENPEILTGYYNE